MSFDYDLVVIGSSKAGIEAAVMAAGLCARVALIEQQVEACGRSATVSHGVLLAAGRMVQRSHAIAHLGILRGASFVEPRIDGDQIRRWAMVAEAAITPDPTVLAAQGIEVIRGCGEFCRKPAPGFMVNGRLLRSRTYLLATNCCPMIPAIDGLQTTGYLTVDKAIQLVATDQPPGSVVIIGASVMGIELAQAFNRLGFQVNLIMAETQLLPPADPEVSRLIQAQLEAEGVRVLTGTRVTQVRQIQGRKWVQAGNQAIETDEILLAIGQEPDVAALNLAAVGVQWSPTKLTVNSKLQTTNRRIYACNSPVQHNCLLQRESYRAAIAVKNALFLPFTDAMERFLPWTMDTDPMVAWVGLTEPMAIARYGKDLQILRSPAQSFKAQIQGETTGFCKLLVRRNGQLVGAHSVGTLANEMASTIALAMRQQQTIQALANQAFASPLLAENLRQLAAAWHQTQLAQYPHRRDWLESFFALRRSWF